MGKNTFLLKKVRSLGKRWRGSFLLGLILTLGTKLPGQVQELGAPFITNYETEKFGANRQNWVAVQDQRGIMYFGNSSGILEFDGQRWQLISVPGNAITRALTCGPDGTIYYGSIGDFGYLAVSPSGKVAAVSLKEAIPQADRLFNDVWQALSSRHGIYFLSREKIFLLSNGKVRPIQGRFASSQACLLNETVFYADMDKGLCLLERDRAVPLPQLAKIYNGKRIALAPFSRHRLLVGRISGDFLQLDLESLWDGTAQRFDISRPAAKEIVKSFPCELDAFLMENNGFLYKLVPLGESTFALSTLKGGIAIFDRNGKIVRVINTNHGLLDNTVGDVFFDQYRNLWAANNSGISHIELSVPQSYFGERNNINGVSISATVYQGRLYVGTFQDMLVRAPYHFALQDDKQTFIKLKNSPNEVWQFLEVEGDLMAATDQGLFMIQGEEAIQVAGPATKAYSLGTSKLWPGHIFVGLMGGMEVFRHQTGASLKGATRWKFLGRMPEVKGNIRGIAEDANGDLWAGTEVDGLLRIHFLNNDPTLAVMHRFGPEQGLPGLTWIRVVSRGNTLYVLTPKGLFFTTIPAGGTQPSEKIRFAPDTTLGKSFSDPPVSLLGMVFTPDGGAFFTTAEEVVWAIPEKNGQYRMEKRPFVGLPAPDPDEVIYLHPDGSLWLPSKGLFRVDPKLPKDYDQPFTVLVRKVIAKSKRLLFEGTHGRPGVAFGQQRTVFKSNQDISDAPELPYSENALYFEFAAAFYEKPGTTKFQYILEQFDKEWSEWSLDTRKEYTNLPEGRYRFRVRAKNIYGTGGREAVYSLRILPPWYRTIWAYILWILAGGAALVGIIFLYTAKLRRQKDYLEQLVAKRTQELREASLTDLLTGLRNRRFIGEVLQNDISAFIGLKNYLLNAKNQRKTTVEEAVFGLFLVDIDFFKKVNDTYGHDAGDQVLKQFAAILTGSVRLDDAVMRIGGEEFLVVLKKTKPEYLSVFAAKTLEKVAATTFDLGGGKTIQKTCSIGYLSFPLYQEKPGLLTFEQSIMVADLGLLYAKGHGRNQGVCLQAGSRLPSGEKTIQNTVTSLEFALQEGYLRIAGSEKQ